MLGVSFILPQAPRALLCSQGEEAAKTTDTLIYIKLSHSILFKFFYPVSKRKDVSLFIHIYKFSYKNSTFKEKKGLAFF